MGLYLRPKYIINYENARLDKNLWLNSYSAKLRFKSTFAALLTVLFSRDKGFENHNNTYTTKK